jgi:hypothetical protein
MPVQFMAVGVPSTSTTFFGSMALARTVAVIWPQLRPCTLFYQSSPSAPTCSYLLQWIKSKR